MRGARAEIRRTITKDVKGKPSAIKEKTMAVKIPKSEELIGDGNANVARSRTIKMALPYSEAAMSATTTVSLTCNQDDKTIHRTAKLCSRIVEKLLEDDQKDIAEFINEMREG